LEVSQTYLGVRMLKMDKEWYISITVSFSGLMTMGVFLKYQIKLMFHMRPSMEMD
jgi:hypothetical protein